MEAKEMPALGQTALKQRTGSANKDRRVWPEHLISNAIFGLYRHGAIAATVASIVARN
jgi:hypothetical protein